MRSLSATMALKDKVAIVTGASSGIGAATVKEFLKAKMKVVGFARRKEKIENLRKTPDEKLFALPVDVTKPEDLIEGFQWVLKNVGPISVLINNAGLSGRSSIVTGHHETWKTLLDTNFTSVAVACKEAIKIMREHNDDGYIINVSSALGHYPTYNPYSVMYSAAKHASVVMTRDIRTELARMNSKIRITTLSPGNVKTDILKASGYRPETYKHYYEHVPHLFSEDIANTILYLLSTPQHINISEMIVMPTGEDLKKIFERPWKK